MTDTMTAIKKVADAMKNKASNRPNQDREFSNVSPMRGPYKDSPSKIEKPEPAVYARGPLTGYDFVLVSTGSTGHGNPRFNAYVKYTAIKNAPFESREIGLDVMPSESNPYFYIERFESALIDKGIRIEFDTSELG